jgi:quercetin dioxygenase-like cupin family protein
MTFCSLLHLSGQRQRAKEDSMGDFTVRRLDEIDSIFDGVVHRARASLGVSAFGMQVMDFPPSWDGYPNHDHMHDSGDERDLHQEEVYVALAGSAALTLDGEVHEIRPGVLARVGPAQKRRIVPGPDGFRMVAVGGRPGATYRPPAWTELDGPLPTPPA